MGVCFFALVGSSPAISDTYSCSGPTVTIFDNSNVFAVFNNGSAPSFTTSGPFCVTQIITYHWNDANGATPGTIGLTGTSVDSGFATSVGPIQATGSSGQGGAPNVNWTVDVPSNTLIDGTYTCDDSDHSTWSQNASSGGNGFCRVYGVAATVNNPPPPNPPTVTSVSPGSGPSGGGTSVTIGGSGFATGSGATVFDFGSGNHASNVVCSTSSSCTATTPSGSGTIDVLATAGGQTSSPNAPADQFTFVAPPPPPPTVTSVSPASGANAGGTTVTIGGSGFSTAPGATTFDFGPGNPAAGVACASSSSCTATSPPGSGTVDVRATVGGQTSAPSTNDQFTFLAPPTVTGVSPNVGALFGTLVTITGTGFSTASGATGFAFGTQGASNVVCSSSTTCTAITPPEAAGVVDVTATVSGLTSAVSPADLFTYSAGPTVTGVSPSIGPLAGGAPVTISGTGFSTTGGMTFSFGFIANATNVSCSSSTTCTATIPAGTPYFPTVDVIAIVGGGESPANPPGDQYTYFRTTTVAVTSDHDPANPGQAIDYTATVSPVPLTTPPPSSGTVSFSADGTPIAGCAAVPIVPGASGPLPQEAQATATCTQTFAATGGHNITATFTPGTSALTGSTSPALNQAVVNCGASLAGCNLKGVNLNGVNLAGDNLAGDNLQGASLVGTNLQGANLKGSNLQGAALQGANLDGASMQGANFKGANLSNAQVSGDLTGANLGGATLTGANLEGSILNGANLTGVVGIGADFKYGHLMGANLGNSNFQSASFYDADLRQANLSSDNFTNASFQIADIGVPPTATFRNSNLTGANLLALYGTAGSNTFNGVTWSNTTCPDGTNSNADGGTCISNFL